MNATAPISPRPRYASRAYLRAVADHFLGEWRSTNTPTRFYIAGIALIFSTAVLIRLHAPTWWIGGQMLTGATLATAGVVLEFYKLVDRLWDTKLGKLVSLLGGTMVAAVAMALAQLIVNDATGMDPGHFPLTVAFLAPLTAGYLIGVLAWMVVIAGFVWFFVEVTVDVIRSGWALGWGEKYIPKNPTQTGLRFVAVVIMSLLVAVMWSQGEKPYSSFLSGTARWFTYGMEMYGSDPCRLPNTRMRRLSDEVVADGLVRGTHVAFQVRRCALGDSITGAASTPPN